jgi:zinc protease
MNKFFMNKIIVLLFLLFVGTGAFALDCSVYKLDNGQTVIIKQVKNNPIVTIDTWIKTGSINETDKNNGVSHFLEHLFFKGTKKNPPGEFDRVLESKGAVTNAATSKDFTHYYVTIPSNYFDLAIDLHSDMLLNPLVPRKELEKERKVVLEEIAKDANDPSNKVYENFNEMIYTTHPYRRKVLGTADVIGNITREEILEYYNKYYTPSNMITIIIGDVDPQHALDKVKEDFKKSDMQPCEVKTDSKKAVSHSRKSEKQLIAKSTKTDYQPIQSGYVIVGFRGVNAVNSDTNALDVLSTILGEGRSSRLNQNIKEQKQLAYSISAGNSSYKEDGLFLISANYTPDNVEKLQKAIFEEISKIQKQGVTPEELNRAKNVIERDTHYSRESISNISSEIGYTTVLTDNPKYYNEYLNNIKKVSMADVKRVANLYLKESSSGVSIVLPEENKQAKITEKPKIEHRLKLVSETHDTQKYVLDNGATLLISQNDLNDIVAISIYAKGGEFLEKVQGSAFLTAAVMLKGTQKYSSLELAQIIEENGIKVQPGVSADKFSLEILTTKAQLAKTLEILDEVVNRATFEDSEIEKTRTAKLNSIKKSRDVPMNVALEEYRTLIFENSVYSNTSKILEKTLPKVQREDVLEYYSTILNPKDIVISVNGNVDASSLASQLTDIFSNEDSARFDYNNYGSKISPLNSPKLVVKKIADLKTAWLLIGWQTSGLLSASNNQQKDYAALEVIDTLLGSGMSSRLFRNLRDQEGLAYQLGSSFSPNVLRGSFTMYIGTNPKTLNFAKEKMLFEINRLKSEFVSDKELNDAKEKLIGNYLISQETNLEKASSLGWFEASGRGFEFKDSYSKLINQVTASDIVEVANKYFNQNYVTSIVEGN